jgi:sucrose-phosphate synthase
MDQGLYVCMLSLHGLVRGRDPELGRDADTGGQVLYVLELARTLADRPEVGRVELVTRRIDDPSVGPDYAVDEEALGPKCAIVRLPFGPARYIRKELLWNHLDVLVDRMLAHFRQRRRIPDVIHSHYADAGYVAGELSRLLGVPQIHTSHSLGRVKQARLLESGVALEAIERQFNMSRRIATEEKVLRSAAVIVASTRQEIEKQYALYERKRARGFALIPPGTDTRRFFPPRRRWSPPYIQDEVDRFLRNPKKPMILAISRAETVKNLLTLVEAYASDPELQQIANLVLVLGNRDDIRAMEDGPREVFTELLLAIDRFDLHGRVALPKHHRCEDVPELYRLAFKRRGVFVNAGVSELFGLTLIESAASGLPVVATRHGGPPDIVRNCRNGLLVNPLDAREIAGALLTVLRSPQEWRRWSARGIRGVARHYNWPAHVDKYLRALDRVKRRQRKARRRSILGLSRRDPRPLPVVERMLVTDIDGTLIGDRDGVGALFEYLEENKDGMAFAIATGRTLDSAVRALEQWRVPMPDVLITGVGSEIHYGPDLGKDEGWTQHIRAFWRRGALEEALRTVPGLRLQARANQREFKLSYNVDPGLVPAVSEIRRLLRARGLVATLIRSGTFLDVLPMRASKGRAVRYLSYKWDFPLNRVFVAGDSGNDEEMLRGDTLATVVGNHGPELEHLRGSFQVYFAEGRRARGILEGLQHYDFCGVAAGLKRRP